MSKFWFVSFADSRLKGPLKRIRRHSKAMGVFGNRIRVMTENDLDADFRERMKDHLIPGTRGYGWWCWKPQVILQVLREMDDGDVLLYCDAGCSLNPRGVKRLNEYFELAQKHGVVLFQARALGDEHKNDFAYHALPDGQWTKGDMLDYFGVRNNASITQSGQLIATVIFLRKDAESVAMVNEWSEVFNSRFELCDNSPSQSPNLPGFVENRHDQSALSIIAKKRGVFTLSASEYILTSRFASKEQNGAQKGWTSNWCQLRANPIWAKQNKGGFRSLFPVWFKDVVHFMTGGRI